ncbi:MAG: hypothetical protein LAT83_23705 [Kiritimatiellae bacterium]|nr:hypothetical protein [Kiritimatiellia bacterium]
MKIILITYIFLHFSGCLFFDNKRQVIRDPDKWGMIEPGGIYELKQDVVLVMSPRGIQYITTNYDHNSIDDSGKTSILKSGSRLLMHKLILETTVTHSRFNLYGKLVNGEHEGMVVFINAVAHVPATFEGPKLRVNDAYLKRASDLE